jgi:hypothetical protein
MREFPGHSGIGRRVGLPATPTGESAPQDTRAGQLVCCFDRNSSTVLAVSGSCWSRARRFSGRARDRGSASVCLGTQTALERDVTTHVRSAGKNQHPPVYLRRQGRLPVGSEGQPSPTLHDDIRSYFDTAAATEVSSRRLASATAASRSVSARSLTSSAGTTRSAAILAPPFPKLTRNRNEPQFFDTGCNCQSVM